MIRYTKSGFKDARTEGDIQNAHLLFSNRSKNIEDVRPGRVNKAAKTGRITED